MQVKIVEVHTTIMNVSLIVGNKKYEYGNNFVSDFDYPVHWKPKKCGRPYKKSRMLKIIGGVEAKKYKWPWHVAVINIYMVSSFCEYLFSFFLLN